MVRGQNKTYEGPFRRALFFLGILVGMRLILFGMLAFAGTLPVGAPWCPGGFDERVDQKLRQHAV